MRNFTWRRQEIAEGCKRDDRHVHIVITSPKCREVTPRCGKPSLQLFFYDLDPEAIRRTRAAGDDPVKAQELIEGCFSEAQARELAAFVEAHPEDVVANCEAGVSRSPGVVLALRRKYGGDTEEVFRKACPNIHVASVLGRELGVGPFQARKFEGIVDPFVKDEP